MRFVPLASIKVPSERFRKDFNEEALTELRDSILEHGLLHPLVVRETPLGLELVAGERRLRVLGQLAAEGKQYRFGDTPVPLGQVPVLGVDRSELEARKIELEENLRRQDLTWQEKVQAIAQIHELQRAEMGEEWTPADTAKMMAEVADIKVTPHAVRQAIALSSHLHIPEVQRAPTVKEALKRLYRVAEVQLRKAIAEKDSSSPLIQGVVLMQVDAREGLRQVQEPIDVYITDPPYGIGAHHYGFWDKSTVNKALFDDKWSTVQGLMEEVADLMAQKGPKAHAYVFCDFQRFHQLAAIFAKAGWRVWPRPIIWVRETFASASRGGQPFYGPTRGYEVILFAVRGSRPLVSVVPDVVVCPPVPGPERATQKPVELYLDLLRRSAYPRSVVCDPFCGTGPIFAAAVKMNLKAYGFDIDPEAIYLCQQRLKELERGV